MRPRDVALLVIGLLPQSRTKNGMLSAIPDVTVAETARIAPCLLVNLQEVALGPSSRIGFGTVLRDLREVALENSSGIGQWNWISSARPLWHLSGSAGRLRMDEHSAVTSRHYIDCSGGVSIGAFTTIAGVRSTLITHGISLLSSEQQVAGIAIGNYCLVSSNVKFTPGSSLPDFCLLAMGSVVVGRLENPYTLYAGVPAMAKRSISGKYFSRIRGFVSPAQSGNPVREDV